jgi:hypothetical protein
MTQPTIKEVVMSKVEISREKIIEILESKSPKTLTEVYRLLGARGIKLSGSVAGKMRSLVSDIEERLAKNKAGDPVKPEPVAKPGKPKVRKPEETASTPYRKGSAYSKVYQILMEHPDGISRADLIREAARRCKKPANRSAFDVAVVVSPRESCTGPRHRSARDFYYVEVEGSCFKLRTD